jgi:beta-lactamase class A
MGMTEAVETPFFDTTEAMDRTGQEAVTMLLERFGDGVLNAENFGFVVLRENGPGERPSGFSYRGDWRCYPCSVVKVFHLIHALFLLQEGRIKPHPELDRAMRDMILWSSNMATNYVIDIITDTTGDTLLEGDALSDWTERRDGLNHFFQKLDWPEFRTSNITQKLMDDMRYGREAQYAGPGGANMNALTPMSAARVFAELFVGESILIPAARKRAQDILLRDRSSADAKNPLFQVNNFLGAGIPPDCPIWSKAGRLGWTGDASVAYHKHDLLRTIPEGQFPLIISIMTNGKAVCEDQPEVFSEIGRLLFEKFFAA